MNTNKQPVNGVHPRFPNIDLTHFPEHVQENINVKCIRRGCENLYRYIPVNIRNVEDLNGSYIGDIDTGKVYAPSNIDVKTHWWDCPQASREMEAIEMRNYIREAA